MCESTRCSYCFNFTSFYQYQVCRNYFHQNSYFIFLELSCRSCLSSWFLKKFFRSHSFPLSFSSSSSFSLFIPLFFPSSIHWQSLWNIAIAILSPCFPVAWKWFMPLAENTGLLFFKKMLFHAYSACPFQGCLRSQQFALEMTWCLGEMWQTARKPGEKWRSS